jgi:predicted nucleotidyltransferase
MKSSITTLPEIKQRELSAVLEALLHTAKPEMVILFGSYSKGGWVEDKGISDYAESVISEDHQY